MLCAPVDCPTEIASYQCLLINRTSQKSHAAKVSDRPPGLIQHVPIKKENEDNASENSTASNENRLGSQWRQQPLSAATYENREIRSNHPQYSINRDQTNGTANVQNVRNQAGNIVKDSRPFKSADNPNKGLTSAEQQRLQFQKEREEIELQRQKLKSSGESRSGLKSVKFEDLQGQSNIDLSSGHTGYHDECDQLMDELAGTSGNKRNNNNDENFKQSQKLQLEHVVDTGKGNQPFSLGMKKTSIGNIFNSVASSSIPAIKNMEVEANHAILSIPPSVMSPTSHLNFNYESTINCNNSNNSKSNNQNSLFLYPAQSPIEIHKNLGEKDFLPSSDYMNELVMGADDMGGDDDYEISMRLIEQMVGDDDDDDVKNNNKTNDYSDINKNDDKNRSNYKNNIDNSNIPHALHNDMMLLESSRFSCSIIATPNSFPIPSAPYSNGTSQTETILPKPPTLIPDNYQQSLGKVTTSARSMNGNEQFNPSAENNAKVYSQGQGQVHSQGQGQGHSQGHSQGQGQGQGHSQGQGQGHSQGQGEGQGRGLSVNINSLFAAARAQSGDNSGIVQMSPASNSNSNSNSAFQSPRISDSLQGRSFTSPNNKNSQSQTVEKYERNVTDRSSSFDILVKLGHQQDELSYSPYSQNSQRMSNKLLQSPKRVVIFSPDPHLLTPDSSQRNQYGSSNSNSNSSNGGGGGEKGGSRIGTGNGSYSNMQSTTPTNNINGSGNGNSNSNSNSSVNKNNSVSPFAFHSNSSGGGSSGGLRRNSNTNNNNGFSSTSSSSPTSTSTSTSSDISKNIRPLGNSNISATSRLQLMKIQRGLTPAKKSIVESTTHTPIKITTSTPITTEKNSVTDIPKRNIEKLRDELKLSLAIAPNPESVQVPTNSNEMKNIEIRNEIKNMNMNIFQNEKVNGSVNEKNGTIINTNINTSSSTNKISGGSTPGLQRINLTDLFKKS